jgi:hypothetical protein
MKALSRPCATLDHLCPSTPPRQGYRAPWPAEYKPRIHTECSVWPEVSDIRRRRYA